MIVSGRDALGAFDGGLAAERAEIETLEDELADVARRVDALATEDLADLRRLARVRLDAETGAAAVERLDSAEARAREILAARDAARSETSKALEGLSGRREAFRRRRAEAVSAVEAAAARLSAAEAETEARLQGVPEHVALAERAAEAARIAAAAAAKADESASELEAKGAVYRADRLFAYLRARSWGTPAYSGGPLTRGLDAWVARVARYADAGLAYSRLTEIPKRLREHADRLAGEAEAAASALDEATDAARAVDGLDALDAALDAAEAELDAVERDIAASAEEERDLLARRAELSSGEDEHTREAVDFLAGALRRAGLEDLRRDAAATPFPEDDAIVGAIADRAEDRRGLLETRRRLKAAQDRRMERLEKLTSMRGEFRRQRYERPDVSFENGSAIGGMLGEVLEGALDSGGFWKQIGRQSRRGGGLGGTFGRPRPPFGGVRPPTGGSRPRPGGGGFRTGGRF